MFSVEQKRQIAAVVERALLDLHHPEMPTERPRFSLHVQGAESWSWADIKPNWVFDEGLQRVEVNPWNERQAQ